ncbi:MAG TPA: AraC family transcriptional regulator ligand-binding domain-containing protein, partial [Burkholderiaceae bacterium]|nr:AraC family transcriptional regulator ligand-binding domain-containing protein [Burkholderiaceae bacterium]
AQVRPPAYHILGQALLTCACLKDALALMSRYQRLVSEAGTLYSTEQDGDVVIAYLAQPEVTLIPQQVEAIFSGLMRQASWLTPSPILPVAVSFAHSMQTSADAYRQAFGILPTFDTPSASMRFDAHALTQPLPYADAALHQASCQAADHYIDKLPPVGFVSGFISQWLQSHPLHLADIEQVAGALGSSVRSIQRQLQAEQSSWQALLDDARRNAAHALLSQHRTLDQVAQEIGYHDASSLSRAIRRWSGTTSSAWLDVTLKKL